MNFITGLSLSVVLGGLGFIMRGLSITGYVGAVAIGTTIYTFGGWTSFILLLLFFFSSTLLTKFRYSRKLQKGLAEIKGGARGLSQTIGQAGVAALLAAVTSPDDVLSYALVLGFVSALAEANADTWAVEIGILSRSDPRLITNLGRSIPPGTSGGVSRLGELSALLGAAFIALGAVALGIIRSNIALSLGIVTLAALLGEHVDSLLGATIQAIYFCPKCQKETERRIHTCGTESKALRGVLFMTNEMVNLLSTGTAALISAGLYLALA